MSIVIKNQIKFKNKKFHSEMQFLILIISINFVTCLSKHSRKNKVIRVNLPSWKPKENFYNPRKVDWSSVISGCKAACHYEKRLCNFYIRASAHDSLSVSEGFGGADGSLLLTKDELLRSENNYDNFAYLLSKNALALAKKYDTSVADIIAVCGAVATEFLGGPKIIKSDNQNPFLVGRHDRTLPNPINSLAPANMNTTGFSSFAKSKNLTIEEMTALMGSHTLLDEKGCLKKDNSYCNPKISNCTDTLMYNWSNIYYKETCVPKIRINNPRALSTLPLPTREFFIQQDLCKFTSVEFRKRQEAILAQELAGIIDPKALVIGQDLEYEDVTWYDDITKITKKWMYTIHDAWMGKACQGDVPKTSYNSNIQKYMNKFKDHSHEWDITYIRAYKKMVNTGAIWNKNGGLPISGLECHSGYESYIPKINCDICNIKYHTCPGSCKCKSAFGDNISFYQ